MMKKPIFTYEYVSSLEELRYIILDNCEGGHIQQVAYVSMGVEVNANP